MRNSNIVKKMLLKNNIDPLLIPFNQYHDIALNDLLLCSLYAISNYRKEPPTKHYIRQDDWFAQTFFMFPLKFFISQNWPTLPNTERMTKRWRDLRAMGYITGANKLGFKLTRAGMNKSMKILNKMTNVTLRENQIDVFACNTKGKIQMYDERIIKTFMEQDEFNNWDEKSPPRRLTIYEITKLLRIPSTSLTDRVNKKIVSYLQENGELDNNNLIIMKARKYLTLQAYYYINYFKSITFNTTIKRNIKQLHLDNFIRDSKL